MSTEPTSDTRSDFTFTRWQSQFLVATPIAIMFLLSGVAILAGLNTFIEMAYHNLRITHIHKSFIPVLGWLALATYRFWVVVPLGCTVVAILAMKRPGLTQKQVFKLILSLSVLALGMCLMMAALLTSAWPICIMSTK